MTALITPEIAAQAGISARFAKYRRLPLPSPVSAMLERKCLVTTDEAVCILRLVPGGLRALVAGMEPWQLDRVVRVVAHFHPELIARWSVWCAGWALRYTVEHRSQIARCLRAVRHDTQAASACVYTRAGDRRQIPETCLTRHRARYDAEAASAVYYDDDPMAVELRAIAAESQRVDNAVHSAEKAENAMAELHDMADSIRELSATTSAFTRLWGERCYYAQFDDVGTSAVGAASWARATGAVTLERQAAQLQRMIRSAPEVTP